jgi:hypothetical protein
VRLYSLQLRDFGRFAQKIAGETLSKVYSHCVVIIHNDSDRVDLFLK